MPTGNIKTETRQVSDFDRVELSDFGEMTIVQDDHESLTIEADEELLSKIKTEVRDGVLVIGMTQDWLDRIVSLIRSLDHKQIIYRLTVKNLHGIRITGAATINASSLKTDHLELRTTGFGKIALGSLTTDSLSVDISGRGEFQATGTAGEQKIGISGSGEYHASELHGREANVRISGHGNVELDVSETLTVSISGAGNVRYSGSPTISQTISGAGSVTRVGAQT